MNTLRHHIFHIFGAFVAVSLVLAVYLPGLSGALYYDDYSNLEQLPNVQDIRGALQFVTSGTAGPTGRPVALLSFLPHANGWPDNSRTILLANIVVHVVNAALAGVLSWLLLCRVMTGLSKSRIYWIALSAALLWASLPLHASSSLIAIQRMTGLAAAFTLLGLIGFIWAHKLYSKRPGAAWVTSIVVLAGATALGTFTKETAALTPVFALIIAILFFDDTPQPWKRARNLVLWALLLIILIYLSPLQRDWFTTIEHRGWSPWERLQTQSILLWDYLSLGLFPHPTAFSPFHDHTQIIANDPRVVIAVLGWILTFALALWLSLVRHSVWLLFALLWFLGGHLLESTTIGLELKFEHRNYLPLFGISLALAVAAFSVKGALRRVAPILLGLFIALQLSILAATTSLWGQPEVAATTWADREPGSARALTHLVLLNPEGIGDSTGQVFSRLFDFQRQEMVLARMDRTLRHCPECLGIHIHAINLSCRLTEPADTTERVNNLLSVAKAGEGRHTEPVPTIDTLFQLRDRVLDATCPPLDSRDLLALISVLLENRYFHPANSQVRLLFLSAALADDTNDSSGRDAFLTRAEVSAPNALPILEFQVYSALHEGRSEDALAAIERRRAIDRREGVMSDRTLDELQAKVLR